MAHPQDAGELLVLEFVTCADSEDPDLRIEAAVHAELHLGHVSSEELLDHPRLLAGWAGDRAELVLFEEGNHNTIHFRHYGEILRRVIEFTQVAVATRSRAHR